MTPAELRELDARIAEHVMGVDVKNVPWYCPQCRQCVAGEHVTHDERHDERYGGCGSDVSSDIRHYTTDPAASFAVLEKCAEHMNGTSIAINKRGGFFNVAHAGSLHISVEAETLELAVAEFSKKLFQGKEKV